MPERTHEQIMREVSHDASKLDAGAQILTGAKANLGGRAGGGTQKIVQIVGCFTDQVDETTCETAVHPSWIVKIQCIPSRKITPDRSER